VGIVGLGTMGAAMALRFAETGTAVVATSRSASSRAALSATDGVQVVETLTDLVASLETAGDGEVVVLTSLPSGPQVASVAEALLVAAPRGRQLVLVDTSTCSPADARIVAQRFSVLGHVALDAPVSGGPTGARAGTLSVMVGGDADHVARIAARLAPIAGRVVHCGPSGAGQVTKAANQLVVAVTVEAVAEALTLAARSGVDPATAREALLGGYAASRVLELQGGRMIAGDFTPGGTIALLAKDVGIIRSLASEGGVPVPALEAAAGQVDRLASTHPDLDHSAVVTLLGGLP
jgi:2-hydroxy-3-oxopropionate reductase